MRILLKFFLILGLPALVSPAAASQLDPNIFTSSRPDHLRTQLAIFPDFSKITLTWQDNGYTTIIGSPGAIPGAYPVVVVSANSGSAARTNSRANGSFITQIVTPPGSWVTVKYDPTAAGGQEAQWIIPFGKEKAFGGDIASHVFGAAPGTWIQVPLNLPSEPDRPFHIAGEFINSHVNYTLSGAMKGPFKPGGKITVSGILTVYPKKNGIKTWIGERPQMHWEFMPLSDARGRARMAANFFYSNILTPTGLPIEHTGSAHLHSNNFQASLQPTDDGTHLQANFSVELTLPDSTPPGTYNLWLGLKNAHIRTGSLGGPRAGKLYFLTRQLMPLPPFTIGTPTPPRLIWTLLTDVPASDGSRGTIAAEDEEDFQLASHVAMQSHAYIIPRDSKKTGRPLSYRLEPFLPMISHGERRIPNPPPIEFKFPSGSLSVRVTRPDGSVDLLGPKPFVTARSRTPTTGNGNMLARGSGDLTDVFQLSTASDLFDYQFPDYGKYTIEMTGSVEDIYGNTYNGGGTYTVFIAETLDIEPATLPMTPFEVGDALNPGITVLPGVPADITVEVSLFVDSDPAKKVSYKSSGRANRFGVFNPGSASTPMTMTGPGEFIVETTARYTDKDGVLWMGARRWGQVVQTPGSPVIARGRRGRDPEPLGSNLWFVSKTTGPTHIRFPYASGDILWQSPDDAAIPIISLQDTEGKVEKAMRARVAEDNYPGHRGGPNTAPFGDRAQIQELPLTSSTGSGIDPALAPKDIVSHGYWYAGVQRPGVRVREMVSDDQGTETGYWRFDEIYALQPGVGLDGDNLHDFKFQYGGAVFRDKTRQLNRYAIYGSLWTMLPEDDARGSRVFPPFQGANGGPSGGPIMTLAGREIDAFVVPLAVRPGTILEVGDTFSFSAALAPTLPGKLTVVVSGPKGFSRTIGGRANAIGYFYKPHQDFRIKTSGRYHVSVKAIFDAPTSAGPMSPPYPSGSILGAVDEGFYFYVVEPDSPALETDHPPWSVVKDLGPVPLVLNTPNKGEEGIVHYTIGMPGFQLKTGVTRLNAGRALVVYDPQTLRKIFNNIDLDSRGGQHTGLADTIWVSTLLEGERGGYFARHFTLQGPDLYAPQSSGRLKK